jgi:hypothetical protein
MTAQGFKYANCSLSYDDFNKMSRDYILDKHRYAYIDLSVTNDYVFALHSGAPEGIDINDKKYLPHIRIFDWEGTPLASLKLDNMIIAIAFDNNKNLLYGVDSKEEKIFIYDLSSVLPHFPKLSITPCPLPNI